MNKEQQELVNEAYIKYQNQTMFHTDDLVSLKELDGMYMSTGEKTKVYRQFAPKEFINKCKTDQEFSEKWGLTIEERELSELERMNIGKSKGMWKEFQFGNVHEPCNERGISTKLITIKYNDKTIESYE
jgi:hypothetical protein